MLMTSVSPVYFSKDTENNLLSIPHAM